MAGLPKSFSELRDLAVYQALRQTAATRSYPLVAVVGAGLSAPAGLPSWPALRSRLVEELRQKASRLKSPKEAGDLAFEAGNIATMASHWAAFQRLEERLGEATFRSVIREALAPGDDAPIPENYDKLWGAPIRGILTVNLDNFARRSFSKRNPGTELKWFTGAQAGRLQRLIHSRHQFAINLHGYLDDSATWVFTSSELRRLYQSPGYKQMLASVFSSHTALFLGISADDTAIGGPLQELATVDIEGPTHYWLTDREDSAADQWAESVGIRLIPYDSAGGNHSIVGQVLDDLSGAVATEVVAPPVVLTTVSGHVAHLPNPQDMLARPLEEIRKLLNARAVELLSGPGGESRYQAFVEEYAEVVHRAWFTPRKGEHVLFGYTLHQQIARGAFGRVYEATAPNGERVAVKVLKAELSNDIDLLQSFRRGVQAMKILERERIAGMVAYREASEIPAFVSMDWIDGPNLKLAKEAGLLAGWEEIVWVARELVSVIKRAHELPERVLHRDLRPANVMLKGGWLDRTEWRVVVLDFDLSTFREARQMSVLAEGSALGFLAPEQLEEHSRYSTRNAAVDAFGIGMTCMFLCAGEEPEAYMQRRGDFAERVRNAVRTPPEPAWRSLPARFGRLILGSTVDQQPARWEISQIERELTRLATVLRAPTDVRDADLLCEEVAARCARISSDYRWDSDLDAVQYNTPGGLALKLHAAVEYDSITLSIGWVATGVEDRSRLAKYLPDRTSRAAARLRSSGWLGVRESTERQSMQIAASLNAAGRLDLDRLAEGLDAALDALTFQN